MHKSRLNLKRSLISLFAIVFSGMAWSGLAADEKRPHSAEWSYDGGKGPRHWAELSPAYRLCREGKRQSPIDLREDAAFAANGVPLKFSYQPDTVDEVNNGHTVEEIIHNGSSVTYDGRKYQLKQFHFHSHSEHTVNGHPYPLEIHLVHQDEEGHVLVVGVFFEEGKANPALEPMLRHLPKKPGGHEIDNMERIDLRALLPKRSPVFTYDGSLTTPPASEGVRWFVYQRPMTISAKQLEAFKKLYDHNYRPVQPLNGRMVGLFRNSPAKKK